MKTSAYEKWFEDELWRRERIAPEHLKSHMDGQERNNQERKTLLEKFPHVVVVEGFFPEFDKAEYVLWGWIGPPDGKCHQHYSEFPACYKVLRTEKKVKKFYTGNDGKEKSYETTEYSKEAEHSHEGTWGVFGLGKTDYDYGFAEFYFKEKTDLELFVSLVPLFTPNPDEFIAQAIVQALKTTKD